MTSQSNLLDRKIPWTKSFFKHCSSKVFFSVMENLAPACVCMLLQQLIRITAAAVQTMSLNLSSLHLLDWKPQDQKTGFTLTSQPRSSLHCVKPSTPLLWLLYHEWFIYDNLGTPALRTSCKNIVPKRHKLLSTEPLQWMSWMTLEWAQNLDPCLGNGIQLYSWSLHCLGLEDFLYLGGLKIHNHALFNFIILSKQKA